MERVRPHQFMTNSSTPVSSPTTSATSGSPTSVAAAPTEVHPSYDPVARVWFLEDRRGTEPTLRALQSTLPSGTVIADYYPEGYSAYRLGYGAGSRDTLLSPVNKVPRHLRPKPQLVKEEEPPLKVLESVALPATVRAPRIPTERVGVSVPEAGVCGFPRKIDWDAVLEATKKPDTNFTQIAIDKKVSYDAVRYIVNKSVAAGDERAIAAKRRAQPFSWDEEAKEKLRDLAARHLTGGQISKAFDGKVSRSAVIAKCARLGIKLGRMVGS